MSTPLRAAAESADTTDTGVEITSAHGQAITSNTSARYNQTAASAVALTAGTSATATANVITAGVYQRAKRSTNDWTGARLACAVSTRWMMRARRVSRTRRVTRISSAP